MCYKIFRGLFIQELLANNEAEKEPVQRTQSSMPDPGRKFSRKFSKYIPR